MTILDKLADYARYRVQQNKQMVSLEEVKEGASSSPKFNFEFEKALMGGDISIICECKKASPSKGIIADQFQYIDIAREYEAAGADCISVLTEPKWFMGSDKYLQEIASQVSIPCLRKDFVVDEYMIYEAKLLGAKAVLLIASILTDAQLKKYFQICEELGLTALFETHNEEEIKRVLDAGARVVGVNNRNLKDFSVDTENSARLRKLIPENVIYVSESGIATSEDVRKLRDAGVDAVLIGEVLMRAADKRAKLQELKGAGDKKI